MTIVPSATKMSRLFNVLFTQTRTYIGKGIPKEWKKDGVKYGLITYYPRHPDHKDPPITPTKLFRVQRVKPYKGNPWWHKKLLDNLRLNDKKSDIAIVKNTPEMCAILWKIKHLIKVLPLNAPENFPEPEQASTVLHENGDLLITPRIDPSREKATKEFINYPKRMDRPYLNDVLRRRWLAGENP